MSEQHALFDAVLQDLSDRSRDDVLAAFSAVQYAAHPVAEVQLAGLRDVTLRRQVQKMLKLIGRTLVPVNGTHWTSGYADDIAATLTAQGWQPLSAVDRAVLVLVLVHSVAIPRSEGILTGDSWQSARPTTVDELRTTRISGEERRLALQRLRAAGLIQLSGDHSGGPSYIPGPQLQRLTPAARRRLQDQLILAAAPASPIAEAIRARAGTSAPEGNSLQPSPSGVSQTTSPLALHSSPGSSSPPRIPDPAGFVPPDRAGDTAPRAVPRSTSPVPHDPTEPVQAPSTGTASAASSSRSAKTDGAEEGAG